MSVDTLKQTIQNLSERKDQLDLVLKNLKTRTENESDPDRKQTWEMLSAFALASSSYCDQLENIWIANFALKNQMETLKEMILSISFIKDNPEVRGDIETLFKKYDSTH